MNLSNPNSVVLNVTDAELWGNPYKDENDCWRQDISVWLEDNTRRIVSVWHVYKEYLNKEINTYQNNVKRNYLHLEVLPSGMEIFFLRIPDKKECCHCGTCW